MVRLAQPLLMPDMVQGAAEPTWFSKLLKFKYTVLYIYYNNSGHREPIINY
jgi:hypothetical protein